MPRLDTNETLYSGKKSSESSCDNAMTVVRAALVTNSDKAINSDDFANNLVACTLDEAGTVHSLAADDLPPDPNIHGKIIGISKDFTADGDVNIPNSYTIQTNGDVWFLYETDNPPTVGENVGLGATEKGKVRLYPAIGDEVFTDLEAAGERTHEIRYCICLQVDSTLEACKVWMPN